MYCRLGMDRGPFAGSRAESDEQQVEMRGETMCLAFYVAGREALPLIAWNRHTPGFYVEAIEGDDEVVRRQFTLSHVYYVGSHEGCGCGFFKEGEVGEELGRVQENYRRLAEYLRQAQKQGGDLELFTCWEGDQGRSPGYRETLTPADLEDADYEFKYNEEFFAKIVREER